MTGRPPFDNDQDRTRATRNRRAYDGRPRRRRGRLARFLTPLLRLPRRPADGFTRLMGSIPSKLRRVFIAAQARRWRHLLQGLPALLLLIGVIGVATATSLQRDTLIPTYKRAAQTASDAGEREEALLYWRRLLRLDGGSPETRFAYAGDLLRQAQELEARGPSLDDDGVAADGNPPPVEPDERARQVAAVRSDAWNLLAQVAPSDSPGLPEAHLFLAQEMLSKPDRYLVDPENRTLRSSGIRELQHHLLVAERGMPNSVDVQLSMFAFYKGMHQTSEAAAALEKVAKVRPQLRYDLTLLYSRMNRREDALRNLKLAAEYYEDQVRAHPENDLLRIRCAALRLNQGDLDGCVQLLEFGLAQSAGDNSPYPQVLAQTHVSVYDVLTARGSVGIEPRLDHLRKALAYRFDYQPALQRMMQLFAGDKESVQQVEVEIRRMIAEGKFPAMGHFALGTKAWKNREVEQALWHLERAVEIDPDLGYAGNNLAWMLADKEPPELQRALRVIERVVASSPRVPTYRDTRGHIHLKLGNWKAALADFEFALPNMRNNRQLHRNLAHVYTQLGQPSLATEHLAIAERLEQEELLRQQTNSVEDRLPQFSGPESTEN